MSEITRVKPLKLGFIGGSLKSAVGYAHFVASTMDNKFKIEAGCFSESTERNYETAHVYGVNKTRVYYNWNDLLIHEKGQLDAVLILLPTPLHFEVAKAFLSAGYAVICEKALAMKSSEAQLLSEIVSKNQSFLAVIYNYSGYPMVRELQKKIRNNELGEILHFQVEMPQEGYIRTDAQGKRPQPQSWRLHEEYIPKIHLDLAVHLHQLLYYLLDKKPQSVISDQQSYGFFTDVIDNVNCLCRYSDNVQGHIWFSKSSLGHRNGLRIRIYGSKASAEWFQMNPEELYIAYSDGRREIVDRASNVMEANQLKYNRFKAGHPAGFIEAFANLYTDIADSLVQFKNSGISNNKNVFGAELSKEGLLFFESMIKSVENRTWQIINYQ